MSVELIMDSRVHKDSDYLVNLIYDSVIGSFKNTRTRTSKSKVKGCLQCIVKTLLYMDKEGYGYASVSLDESDYTGKAKINGEDKDILPSYSYMIDLLPLLHELKWIKYKKHDQLDYAEYSARIMNHGFDIIPLKVTDRCSTIRRGKRWKQQRKRKKHVKDIKPTLSVIEIRDMNKNLLPVPDTEETRQLKKDMFALNDWMNSNKVVHQGERLFIWLKRIYQMDFEQGGRYYSEKGTVQSIPKQERFNITIAGESISELDYVSCQYRILADFNAVNLEQGFDPYFIPELPQVSRSMLKKCSVVMLNTSGRKSAYGAVRNELKHLGVKPKQVFDALIDHNWYVKDYAFKQVGMKLQKIESEICGMVLDICMRDNVPVFPIHDSFLCRAKDKELLHEIMLQSWRNVLGLNMNCKIKEETL